MMRDYGTAQQVSGDDKQWRIQGAGGDGPPVGGLKKIFLQYINIITKPTAYDGPWEY